MGSNSPTIVNTPAATPSGATPVNANVRIGSGITPEPASTQLPSPETVLHTAEIEQTRRMAITGVLFNVVAVASAPLFGGNVTAKHVATV